MPETKPKLSIIVISFQMQRELPRTLYSLTEEYQKDISANDYEVIVVDNGTTNFDHNLATRFGPQFISLPSPVQSHSPVDAINFGISRAQAPLIGVMIDGARICSPGILSNALRASRMGSDSVIGTMGFHLGPEVQMKSVLDGYCQASEDELLDSIDWQKNGYALFDISVLAGSSARGFYQPIAESNAVFLSKEKWRELGGYDSAFSSPGGGYTNLDLWKRACASSKTPPIILISEGTFHQVHGGIATNGSHAQRQSFQDEYVKVKGENFTPPDYEPIWYGVPHAHVRRFLDSGK